MHFPVISIFAKGGTLPQLPVPMYLAVCVLCMQGEAWNWGGGGGAWCVSLISLYSSKWKERKSLSGIAVKYARPYTHTFSFSENAYNSNEVQSHFRPIAQPEGWGSRAGGGGQFSAPPPPPQ